MGLLGSFCYIDTITGFLSRLDIRKPSMRPLFLAGFFLLAFAAIQRRHYIRGALCGLLGLYISLYLKSCRHWLDGLGSDSFSEAQNFAWKEALFFLETISSILQPLAWNQLLETAGIALLITALIIVALRRADRWVPSVAASHRIVLLLGAVCLAIPMGSLARHAYARFQSNSAIFESIQRNFTHPDLKLAIRETGEHRMRLLVYIGESTTSLHWSLYGYPRNTTPRLDAFREREPGFLVFRDVISTQVMTSPSLLEALSFQWAPGQAYLPINERQRVSLVDVLRRLSIPTRLFSNQAASGTYSLAGPIIFRHATHVDYSRKHAAVMGDLASKLGALPDDRYFLAHAPWFDSAPGLPAVTFLHSYAGHGDYLGNIPPDARSPVDTRLQGVSPARVFGEALDDNRLMARNAEGYDSAMRYVDRSIHSVLEQVRAFDQPTVFLYFADHGESPYTNVGHDSARFHHEMFRVPFLMYFNDAAQQAAPELFTLFSQASRQARPSTLAQVPATILRLLGYRLEGIPQPYQGIGLDDPASLAPVVVRRLGDTFSYVRGHGTSAAPPPQARDDTDRATRIWLHRRGRIGNTARPTLCYGGTNTWAKAVRGGGRGRLPVRACGAAGWETGRCPGLGRCRVGPGCRCPDRRSPPPAVAAEWPRHPGRRVVRGRCAVATGSKRNRCAAYRHIPGPGCSRAPDGFIPGMRALVWPGDRRGAGRAGRSTAGRRPVQGLAAPCGRASLAQSIPIAKPAFRRDPAGHIQHARGAMASCESRCGALAMESPGHVVRKPHAGQPDGQHQMGCEFGSS